MQSKNLAFLLLGLLIGSSAGAATWERVATDDSKSKLIWDVTFISIDRESVIAIDHQLVKAWFKTENVAAEPLPAGVPKIDESKGLFKSTLALMHFNCYTRSSATVERIYYDEHGRVLGSISIQRQWNDVAPETIGEVMLKAACGAT